MDDFNRKSDAKRPKSDTDSIWSFKAENSVKPASIVIPKFSVKPNENAISYTFAATTTPTTSHLIFPKKELVESPAPVLKPVKPDPGLRDRWMSSFARTTITMTPFQTPAVSSTSTSSTVTSSMTIVPYKSSPTSTSSLSDTISKLQSSLIKIQSPSQPSFKPQPSPTYNSLNQNGEQARTAPRPNHYPNPANGLYQKTSTAPVALHRTHWPVQIQPQISRDTVTSSLLLPSLPTTLTNGQVTSRVDDRIRRNRQLVISSDEILVKTSLAVQELLYTRWNPPLVLPHENIFTVSQWGVRATAKMDKGLLCIRLTGPLNISRPFTIPFSNIFASSSRTASWPPSEEMMSLCDDLSRWELDICVDPYTDIKATVIDPWNKAYLLTIPVKLMKQKS